MTLETLQMIIDENWESAKNGNASAFAAVIGAQAEIKKINQEKERVLSMGIKLAQKQKGDFKLPDPLVI